MKNQDKPELGLTECDGNAFAIIGRARRVAKNAGWTAKQVDDFSKKCMSGDYDHLLQTCMEHFNVV